MYRCSSREANIVLQMQNSVDLGMAYLTRYVPRREKILSSGFGDQGRLKAACSATEAS